MQSVEVVQARTVDEAVRIALARLGRSYEEVDVEVINAGTPGVLGVGAEDAVVRVSVRQAGMRQPIPPQPYYPGPGPIMGQPIPNARPTPIPPIGQPIPPAMPGAQPPMGIPMNQVPMQRGRAFDAEELARLGRDVIMNLLRRMRIQARTQIEYHQPEPDENGEDSQSPLVTINLVGGDLGVLIGRRGEALTDLQYVFNLIMNKKTRTWGKVMLDVEGYRTRRKANLVNLAHRMAEQVMLTRQPITLEPMPAHERRLVHLALVDHPYIRSESFGEGEERKVTIFPK
ncbi:MAG TPA: RNA-binding cell elongation regulator Jag/EloR [Chloroflexia bacterium]|nr:RNA-binding cell elongation regulator Jag/EloR [Chloroflexia bacterium]